MPGMRKWGVVYARYIPAYTSRGIWHGIYPGGHRGEPVRMRMRRTGPEPADAYRHPHGGSIP